MFEKLADTLSSGIQLREVGPSRTELGGVPRHGGQRNWQYAVIEDDNGDKHLRLSQGKGSRVMNFKINPDVDPDSKHIMLDRLSDSTHADLESGGSIHSKGTFQVHRSEPNLIHGTVQDGRKGVSMEIAQNNGKWTLSHKAPKARRAGVVMEFADAVKTASDHGHYRNTCPECGAKGQCRCSSPNKIETTDLCYECANKKTAAMSAEDLLSNGSCCGNGCVNCPYEPRHEKSASDTKLIAKKKRVIEVEDEHCPHCDHKFTEKGGPRLTNIEEWQEGAPGIYQCWKCQGKISYPEISEEELAKVVPWIADSVRKRKKNWNDKQEKKASDFSKLAVWSKTALIPFRDPKKEKKRLQSSTTIALPTALGALGLAGAGVYAAGNQMLPGDGNKTLENFYNGSFAWNHAGDPRQFIDDYSQAASAAAGNKLFGVLDAKNVMRIGRSLPFIPAESRWNPGSAQHYDRFSKGPLSGYSQLFNEYNRPPEEGLIAANQEHLPLLQSLLRTEAQTGKPSDRASFFRGLTWPTGGDEPSHAYTEDQAKSPIFNSAFERLKKDLGVTNAASAVNVKGIAPADAVTRMSGRMSDFLRENKAPSDVDWADAATQKELYPKFDSWLQGKDPELWRHKQMTDFVSGAKNIPPAGEKYRTVISGLLGSQNALKIVGGGLATLGIGGMIWALHRRAEEKKKRVSDQNRQLDFSVNNPLPIGPGKLHITEAKAAGFSEDSMARRWRRMANRKSPEPVKWLAERGLNPDGTHKEAKFSFKGIRDYLLKKITKADKKVHTEPTEAQKEVGNYRKGHVWIQGLDITIENPKDSLRRGVGQDGKKWETHMANSYGYIRNHPRSEADGDHVDVFIGEHPDSEVVFVIDQYHGDKFDEHKCVIGAVSKEEANAVYDANYSKNWKGRGDTTSLTMKQFKKWINGGDTAKPLAGTQVKEFLKTADSPRIHYPITDAITYPLHAENPLAGMSVGALGGAAVGAGVGLFRKFKRKVFGENPEDEPVSIGRDALMGSAVGLGAGLIGAVGGKNKFTYPDSPLFERRHPVNYGAQKLLRGSSHHAIDSMSEVGTKTAASASSVIDQINNDPTLTPFRKEELIRQVQIATANSVELTPQQLAGAGLGALAGWILAKASGMGAAGQMIGGIGGALFGGWLGTKDPNEITGAGFYRP